MFSYVPARAVLTGLATVAVLCSPVAVRADDKPSGVGSQRQTTEEAPSVDERISDLGSPDWRAREFATHFLMNQGPELYAPLKEELTRTRRYEVRRRIKQIVREIYKADLLGPSPAFLGIQHLGRAATREEDARVSADSTAILIMQVFPLTGAERAGLRRNDLWMALNGKRAVGSYSALEFTSWIASQKPGTPCRLGILRGGSGQILNPEEVRGFEQRWLSKVETRVILAADDPRIPEASAGLLVTNPRGTAGRVDLKRGDVLVALDGVPFPKAGAREMFARWLHGQPVGRVDDKQGQAGRRRRGRVANKQGGARPSAQILRGGKWLEITAILGRRPSFLANARAGGRGNIRAEADAEASFESWWRDWVAPLGLQRDVMDANSDWRLDP